MRSRPSEKIGAAIRKLRQSRGWNLSTLSERTGIPISTLSRVELGQNALNSANLIRLCQALEVDLQGLVAQQAQGAPPPPSGRRAVIRAGDGVRARIGASEALIGAEELLSKSFCPAILEVDGSQREFASHAGEAYILVLDGAVELHSHLYAPLKLAKGDAVYFDAASGYALGADRPARVLLIAAGDAVYD